MKHLKHLLTCAALAVASACGAPTASEIDSSLDTADAYLADGMLAEARNTADAICKADTASMSARQLGHLALIYMQLSERSDDPSTAGQAISCYRAAVRVNADSVAAYFGSLPAGPDHYAITLAEIMNQLEGPRDIPADEPLDEPADTTATPTHTH